MKRRIFVTLLAALIPLVSRAGDMLLSTPRHIVVIVSTCPEGEVTCAKVIYTGIDKTTGASVTIEGSDWAAMCADGTTPCHHLGWQFKKGDTTYRVSDGGELVVLVRQKTVLVEQGKWIDE